MKSNLVAILFLLLLLGCDQPAPSPEEIMLQSLLDNKDYFQLRDRLTKEDDKIDKAKSLYFHAFVDNAFNRNEVSNHHIRLLFRDYIDRFPDSVRVALLKLAGDNYFKTFRYDSASRVDSELLSRYRHAMDSTSYSTLKNTAILHRGLCGVRPQQVLIPGNTTIPWNRNKAGLIEVPVRKYDSTWQAIFDTRADISSVTETYAGKLGLRLLGVSFKENDGINGPAFKTSLGIADSLWLGDILLRHVVFRVIPDQALYLPAPVDLPLNIILGYPVIARLKEVHILQNNTMTIPAHPNPGSIQNRPPAGLDPIVSCQTGGDTLCFEFGTSAVSTDPYNNCFDKYKENVLRHGKTKKINCHELVLNFDSVFIDFR